MGRIREWQYRTVQGSQSIVGFDTENTNWARYLTLNGERAYLIGGLCGTCEFLFERLEGAPLGASVQDLIAGMTSGLTALDAGFLADVSRIIPDGEYAVALMQIEPAHVIPGGARDYFTHEQLDQWPPRLPPNTPGTAYYRGTDQPLNDRDRFFEFIVPMFPPERLNAERVAQFRFMLEAGAAPTALALSVLDIRQRWDSEVAHWCLAHYLLDGHHKVWAASQAGKPLTLLSFMALAKGISDRTEIEELLRSI